MKKFFTKSALLICAVLALFACKEKGYETSLSLDKSKLDLIVGDAETLKFAFLTDEPGLTVVWSSDNEAVAAVDQKGAVTAISVGQAVITARAGEVAATCNVTVSAKPVTVVTLDKTELSLQIGGTETLTATVEPEDATDPTVIWASSNTEVATVDAGVVTALGIGEATISATAGDITAECVVTVLGAPKIGDYYYEDGTWSDGGLISMEADGLNPVWASPKPAPKAGKTVVGIVFQTNSDRIAQTDKEKGFTRGYVVAVKNAHPEGTPTVMYSTDYDFASTPQAKIAKTWYTNINGYNETRKVVEDYGENLKLCPAFNITINSFSLKAPKTSSGWFLPSTGELWDMVANLCGGEVAGWMKKWQTSNYNVYNGYNSETVSYNVIAKFNETISMIPADQKEELFTTHDYWNNCTLWATTCFDPGDTSCVINLGGATKPSIELMCEYIDYDGVARPILAF